MSMLQEITVINASINNPYIAYNFNLNLRSKSQYIKILSNSKIYSKKYVSFMTL